MGEAAQKRVLSDREIQGLIDRNKARKRPWKERFEEKLDRNGPIPKADPSLGNCWNWKPAIGSSRKAFLFKADGATKPFYHWLYEEEHGQTFEKRGSGALEADHVCLNWMCARPSHIEPVTHQENMKRFSRNRKKGLQ